MDRKYIQRVLNACGKDYELAEKVCKKITRKKNEYTAKELPLIMRYVLKEDFQLI